MQSAVDAADLLAVTLRIEPIPPVSHRDRPRARTRTVETPALSTTDPDPESEIDLPADSGKISAQRLQLEDLLHVRRAAQPRVSFPVLQTPGEAAGRWRNDIGPVRALPSSANRCLHKSWMEHGWPDRYEHDPFWLQIHKDFH